MELQHRVKEKGACTSQLGWVGGHGRNPVNNFSHVKVSTLAIQRGVIEVMERHFNK